MNTKPLLSPLWAPEGGGTQAPAQAPAPTTTPAAPPATSTTQTSEGRVSADAGWTPYTPDPAKSAQENLALKEAYDKRAPEGHDPNVKLEPKAPVQTSPAQQQAPAPLTADKLVAPEGFELDPGLSTEFVTTINQNIGDPAKLANALLALQAKANSQASETASQAWDKVQNEWKKQTEADPQIGGAKYSSTVATSKDISSRFGGEKFVQVLELTGMGNHPEWHRFVTAIAPFLKEAKPVGGSAPAAAGSGYSPLNLYPEQGKK